MWRLCNVLGVMHMEVQKLQDCIYFRVCTHMCGAAEVMCLF